MTEKRFDFVMNEFDEVEYITDIVGCEDRDFADFIDFANEMAKENEMLKFENEKYRNMFFEIVETALTDKNCRELYCKGILDIFDKANSLNQAREMIKEHLK